MYTNLPLLDYHHHLRTESRSDGKVYLWDQLRKKYLVLQPEEVVRQLLVCYLIEQGYPPGRMSIEKAVRVYDIQRRYDLVVVDRQMHPYLVVECKSHEVKIGQGSVDQAVLYNQTLAAPFILVTNGVQTLCASVDHDSGTAELCPLPSYPLDT